MGRHEGSSATEATTGTASGRSDSDSPASPSADWSQVSAAGLLELPVPVGAGARSAENLFVPVPGAVGFGPVRVPAASGPYPLERVNPSVRWWEEGDTLAELGWAVEAIFADPTPTGELVRPFVGTEEDPYARWADEAPLPPPRPVDHVGYDQAALPARRMTRRELRERRRQAESLRGTTARRIAKGGVLAVTVFGVVAACAPQISQALRQTRSAQDAGVPVAADLAGVPAAADLAAGPANGPSGAAGAAQAAAGATAGVAAGTGTVQSFSADADDSRSARAAIMDAVRQRLVKENADAQALKDKAAQDKANAAAAALAKQQAAAARKQQIAQAQRDAVRDPKALAAAMVADRGWSTQQFQCLNLLWTRESQWNYKAYNPSSGAYGIPQALPGSKMGTVASDWRTNPATQITWGLNYIADRYGTPCGAWAHSQNTGWY